MINSLCIIIDYKGQPELFRFALRSIKSFNYVSNLDLFVLVLDQTSPEEVKARNILKEFHICSIVIEAGINKEKEFLKSALIAQIEYINPRLVLWQNSNCLHLNNLISLIRKYTEEAFGKRLDFPVYQVSESQSAQILSLNSLPENIWLSMIKHTVLPFKPENWIYYSVHNTNQRSPVFAVFREDLKNMDNLETIGVQEKEAVVIQQFVEI